MGNISNGMETITESKGTSRSKKHSNGNEDAFDELISYYDMAEFSKLEKRSREISKLKCKKKKLWDKKIQALWRNFKRCNMYIIRTPEGEKRENRAQEIFEEIISENFLKLQYTKM